MPRKRPLLLDLFCGEGGAALGYSQAGFDVLGVDIYPQKHYPFPFIRADLRNGLGLNLGTFDAIHASPPCQFHSPMRHMWLQEHENLIPLTLDLLSSFKGPWVIENVEGAIDFMPGSVVVCGAAVGCVIEEPYRYYLRRHRLFMSNMDIVGSGCICSMLKANGYRVVYIKGQGADGPTGRAYRPGENIAMRRKLMRVPHASSFYISQCVPAPYTRFIGNQLRSLVDGGFVNPASFNSPHSE